MTATDTLAGLERSFRSALRFAASHSVITAAEEKAFLASMDATRTAAPADVAEDAGMIAERLRKYRPTNEWGDPIHHVICTEAATTITTQSARIEELENELRCASRNVFRLQCGGERLVAAIRKAIIQMDQREKAEDTLKNALQHCEPDRVALAQEIK